MALWIIDTGDETIDETVESIAKARHEAPCPDEEGPFCNPDMHVWEDAHEDDQAWARDNVRFVLTELGFE